MRKSILLLASVALALTVGLAIGVAPAAAADVTLPAGHCFFAGGGQITEPAGSTITITFADAEVNLGMLEDFLGAETTALTLNGGAPVDVSALFGPPHGAAERHVAVDLGLPNWDHSCESR
jgi:hypothetical protein